MPTEKKLTYLWCAACGARLHRTPDTVKPCKCGGAELVRVNPTPSRRTGWKRGLRRKWTEDRVKKTVYLDSAEVEAVDRLASAGESVSDVLRRALQLLMRAP